MKYIIFSIDTNIQEFLFVLNYTKGEEKAVLGELIKLNNFCYIKNFEFDFFEIIQDPNKILFKEGIYIYEYNTFEDLLNRLNLQLTFEEINQLNKKNKEILNILTKKSKSEILSIIYQENENKELFTKLFLK
jgi:hypothetical protein